MNFVHFSIHSAAMVRGRPTWLAAFEAGVHGSFFYTATEELLDVALPYLKEGLINHNERSVWILPPELDIWEAENCLTDYLNEEAQCFIQSGRLIILKRDHWYPPEKIPFDNVALNRRGKLLLDETLKLGFEGLRLVNHAISSNSLHWEKFLKFEAHLDQKIEAKPVISLCAYSLLETPIEDLSYISEIHSHTLIHYADEWELVRSQVKSPQSYQQSVETLK